MVRTESAVQSQTETHTDRQRLLDLLHREDVQEELEKYSIPGAGNQMAFLEVCLMLEGIAAIQFWIFQDKKMGLVNRKCPKCPTT